MSFAVRGMLLPLLMVGCSGATTGVSGNGPAPKPSLAPTAAPAATPTPEVGPTASSSASAATSAALAPPPPPADPCALPPPRVVVPKAEKTWSPSAFDVGPDGRLHWIVQDPMDREAEVFALDLAAVDAKPQRVVGAKTPGRVAAMIAGRDGYWLGIDDLTQGVCGSRVMWLGRGAQKAIPVSELGCLSGPVRAPGAEALWGLKKTFSHPLDPVVAKGAPPGGLSPLPRGFDGSLEAIASTSDGAYLAFDHGEVQLRAPDGKMTAVFEPLFLTPTVYSHALAVHGDYVYLASSAYGRAIDIFQIPRQGGGGKRDQIASLDTKNTAVELYATDGGVVVWLSHDDKTRHLLLLDPRGVCPRAELPLPDPIHGPVVDRGVVYTLSAGAILASSLGARASAASGAGSSASPPPKAAAP